MSHLFKGTGQVVDLQPDQYKRKGANIVINDIGPFSTFLNLKAE